MVSSLWLALQKRLPTVQRWQNSGYLFLLVFSLTQLMKPRPFFLWMQCYQEVCSKMLCWIGEYTPIGSWQGEVIWAIKWPKKDSGKGCIIFYLFSMVVSLVWRERNMLWFQDGHYQETRVAKEIANHIHTTGRCLKSWQSALGLLNHMPWDYVQEKP